MRPLLCFDVTGGYRIEVLCRATVTAMLMLHVFRCRRENLNSVDAFRWEHPAWGTCLTNPGDPTYLFDRTVRHRLRTREPFQDSKRSGITGAFCHAQKLERKHGVLAALRSFVGFDFDPWIYC